MNTVRWTAEITCFCDICETSILKVAGIVHLVDGSPRATLAANHQALMTDFSRHHPSVQGREVVVCLTCDKVLRFLGEVAEDVPANVTNPLESESF